jgi:hypothetical protein
MKGKNTISTFELFELFPDQESARIYLEGRLWPEGVRCSCCGSVGLSPEAQAGREKEEGQAPEEMTTGVKYVIPITSLEAVLNDASFAPGLPPDRVQCYRPAAELLTRLRTMQKATLRDAIIQVAGVQPH